MEGAEQEQPSGALQQPEGNQEQQERAGAEGTGDARPELK